jgi:multimeric flavodoxin WrbA
MKNVLVSYFSHTGNTAKMAEAVASGARTAGVEVKLKKVEETSLDDLKWSNGIIIVSPTYYGQMAAEVKKLFDRSSDVRGQLENKVGAAFTSSASIGGGNQTTLISIIQAHAHPFNDRRWRSNGVRRALWCHRHRRAQQRIIRGLQNSWRKGSSARN